MDSHGWRFLYQTVREVARTLPRPLRQPQYSDVLIVMMLLWAAGHDRPMNWACQRKHYHGAFRPRRLPCAPQFSRRLRWERTEQLLTGVFRRLAEPEHITPLCFVDGKPLVVGSCSKDRDARAGRIYGGFARGYKIHVISTEDRRILCWSVEPLNVDERPVAAEMIRQLCLPALLLGDGQFDSNPLYVLTRECGGQLLTPVPTHAGQGHREQSPERLAAIAAWRGIAGYVYRERIRVEQTFAHLTSFGGGLGPLPSWVRTLPRVRRWVGAKVILYHVRLKLRRPAA
jgi:hypothetical protein